MTFECNITNWDKYACNKMWDAVCPNEIYGLINCVSWFNIIITVLIITTIIVAIVLYLTPNKQ